MIRLPDSIRACLFDMDGVLTETATVHAAAWKAMFDEFLARREGQAPFDEHEDYDEYVDGKPRYDGVRSFLASRGIELPEGEPDDPPDAETVHGLGNRKNELVQKLIRAGGVKVFDGSRRFLDAVRDAGKAFGRDDDLLAEGTDERRAEDPVAFSEGCHAVANAGDGPRELAAGDERRRHAHLVLVGDQENVGEVHGGGGNTHADLARVQLWRRQVLDGDDIRRSVGAADGSAQVLIQPR